MKTLIRKITLSFATLAVALLVFAVNAQTAPSAYAFAKTAVASGAWSAGATWNGGTVPAAGDDVTINGGFTVSITNGSPNSLSSLTIGGATAGTLTFSATTAGNYTLTVTGDVTIAGNGSLTVTNQSNFNYHTLTIGGNLIDNGTFDMTTANDDHATVVFNGSSQQTISGGGATCTFWSLTDSNTNTNGLVLSRNILLAPAGTQTATILTVTAGDVLDLGSYTANRSVAGAGTITVGAGSTLKIGGTGTFPSNYTTHTLNATSTVEYNGTTQSVLGGASPNYGILKINGSGTATPSTNLTIAGNLTVSAGTLDLTTFTANRTAGGGTLAVSNGATLKIGGTNTFPSNYTTNTLGTTSTVEYNGTAQTVSNKSYGHLTLSNSGVKTMTGVTTVNGNLTLGGTATATTAANLAIGGNLIIGDGTTLTPAGYDLTVTGTTTVGSGASGNLTISSATGTKTFTGLVTIAANGTWTNTAANEAVTFRGGITNGGTFNAGTGVYTFDTNAQALTGTLSIPSVTVTGVTLTNNNTLTVGTALSGTGGLTQGAGATLNIGGTSGITTLTATAVGNTVDYNGSALQAIVPTTYNNLILDNTNGATIGSDTAVGDTLTLTNGTIATGANKVIVSSDNPVTRTNGYIDGNLQMHVATGGTTKTFTVGDASNYTPVDVSFGNVGTAGNLIATTLAATHPNLGTSIISPTKYVKRYWTFTSPDTLGFDNYGAVFHFINPGDIQGGADTSAFIVDKYDVGPGWTSTIIGAQNPTNTGATGMTSFSDFAIGEPSNVAPNAPVLVSPDDGSYTNNVTPTLSANYSDPNPGDTGATDYRISSASLADCTGAAAFIVASGTSAPTADENEDTTWTPGGPIGVDATYYWCARNDDGIAQSAWTNMGSFILDTNNPTPVVTTSPATIYEGNLVSTVTVAYGEAMDPTTWPLITMTGSSNWSLQSDAGLPAAWSAGNTVYTATLTHDGTEENVDPENASVGPASGATDLAGNPDNGDTSPNFVIDTVKPTVSSITNAKTLLKDTDVGHSKFTVKANYDEVMDIGAGVKPVISFVSPSPTGVTPCTGTWNGAGTQFTFTCDVADNNEEVSNIDIQVTGGQDTAGNVQNPETKVNAFSVDTLNPTATSITASPDPVYEGSLTATVTVIYDDSMNTATNPTITLTGTHWGVQTQIGWATTHKANDTYIATFAHDGTPETISETPSINPGSVARDAAGNFEVTGIAGTAFSVDTQKPGIITGITSVAGDFSFPYYDITDNGSTLVVYTPDVDAATCKWDESNTDYDSMANTCESNTNCTLTLTGEGAHTVYMLCMDNAGNKGTSSYQLDYTINTVPPSGYDFSIDQGYINIGNETATSFTFTSAEVGTTYDYTITSDSGPGSVTGSGPIITGTDPIGPINVSGLADGTLTYSVTLTGLGGTGLPVTHSVMKDTIRPTGTVGLGTPLISDNDYVQEVTVTFDEPMDNTFPAGIIFGATSGVISSNGPGVWSDPTPGEYTVYTESFTHDGTNEETPGVTVDGFFGAMDVAGNPEGPDTNATFDIDTKNPTGAVLVTTDPITIDNYAQIVTVTYGEAMNTASAPTITFTDSNFNYNTDGAWGFGDTVWTGTWSHDGTPEEVTGVSVDSSVATATDVAGNLEGPATPDTFDVDTQVPAITGITNVAGDPVAPYEDTTDNSNTLVNFTSSADTANCKWDESDTDYASMGNTCGSATSCNLNLAGVGPKTVYLLCIDNAGNKATSSWQLDYTVSADFTNPSVTSITPNNLLITDANNGGQLTVTVVYDENMDGASTPVLAFSPDITGTGTGTLTLNVGASGWRAIDTYDAVYDIADVNEAWNAIDITVTGAEDLAGNIQNSGSTDPDLLAVDTLNPNVFLVTPSAALITDADSGTQLTVTVIYDEDMAGISTPNLAFTDDIVGSGTLTLNGGLSGWTDTDTYDAVYDIADVNEERDVSDITVTLATDSAGNAQKLFSTDPVLAVDTKNPTGTVLITTDPITLANFAQLLTVTFGEAMDPLSIPAIDFTGSPNFSPAAPGAWDGITNTVWTQTFNHNGTPEEVTGVQVDGVTGARDLAGNPEGPDTPDFFNIDTVRPMVTSAILADANADGIADPGENVIVSFTEAMDTLSVTTGFLDDNLGLSAGTFDVASTAWNFGENVLTITLGAAPTFLVGATVDPDDLVVTDAAGNPDNSAPVSITQSIAPWVTDIVPSTNIITDANAGPSGFCIDINYSENMNGTPAVVSTPDISSTLTGIFSESWTDGDTYHICYTVADADTTATLTNVNITGAIAAASGLTQTAWDDLPLGGIAVDTLNPTLSKGTLIADESACTGAGGTVCKIGDHITFTWDNSVATGDGNTDITSVSQVHFNLSNFGGGTDVTPDSNAGDIYTKDFTVLPGDDDGVYTFDTTVDDINDNTSTTNSTDTAPVDDIAPTFLTSGLTISVDNGVEDVAAVNGGAVAPDKVKVNATVADADVLTITWDATTLGAGGSATQANNTEVTVAPGGTDAVGAAFMVTATDDAGNSTTQGTHIIDGSFITLDNTIPAFSLTAPATGASVGDTKVSYTLSEAIANGGITWIQTGGVTDVGSPHEQALAGAELNTGAHTNITLTHDPILTSGSIYSVDFRGRDDGGNAANPVTNTSVTYTVAPVGPVCGNAICEAGGGETILSCPADCGGGSSPGGGGGSSPSTDPTSNTTTSTVSSNVSDTVTGNQTYSRPIQLGTGMITDTADGGTSAVLTGPNGEVTMKPNSQSTIYMTIPSDTTVTSTSDWNGKISPPVIKSLTLVNTAGEPIVGSTDTLQRSEVTIVIQAGGNTPLTFSNPVTIYIPVDLPDGTVVHVYTSNDSNEWTSEGTAVVVNGMLVYTTNHLTYFAFQVIPGAQAMGSEQPAQLAQTIAGFTDIAGHWAQDYISQIAGLGIVSGKSEGIFAPNDAITRAELTKIAVKAFGINVPTEVTSTTFVDVDVTAWYAPYIAAAKDAGIVNGYEGNVFSPNGLVNRAEALKILLEAAKLTGVEENYQTNYASKEGYTTVGFPDALIGEWFAKYVAYAKDNSIVGGYADGTFGPGNNITRAEVAKIIVKILDMK
jgi:hypothetical protein